MFLYFLALRIASLFSKKARMLVRGQSKALRQLREVVSEGDCWLWVHAASAGEFEQARPIIEQLHGKGLKVLVTFFSPSGYELRKDYELADIVTYLPFATRRNARKLLDTVKVEKALFIKYEYWGAYLRELHRRKIDTYSVASIFRKNQFFFNPLFGGAYRHLLKCFTKILVQDEQSRNLLAQYGITNTEVVGDPRFNRVLEVADKAADNPLVERFTQDCERVIVAGSTWLKDEELLARYIRENEEVRLVLVPHEINQAHLKKIFQLFEGRVVFYSEADYRNVNTCRVLVVNKIGFLSSLYRYARVCYVGGGFGEGIHNTLEPAAHAKPVIFGKRYKGFREAEEMLQIGAAFKIKNYKELALVLTNLLLAPTEAGIKAREYVLSEQEATYKIIKAIL